MAEMILNSAENVEQGARTSLPVGAGEELSFTRAEGGPSELYIMTYERGVIVIGRNSMPEFRENHVYLADVRTSPQDRRKGVAKDMINRIALAALETGYRALYAGVPSGRKNAGVLMKLLKGAGFQMHTATPDAVIYRRPLT
jgi:GNAT superfamily N-acetyltransferase